MKDITVLMVQANIYWESAEKNLVHFSELISSCRTFIDIILLPEMFNTGFSMNFGELAETTNGRTIAWMKAIASERNALIMGSLISLERGKYFNRLMMVFPDGEFAHYNKRHLFTMGNEHKAFTRGNELPAIIEFRGWKILPLICYDLRFPVWSRNNANYDLLIYLANWPGNRKNVWDTLLKARAIENQCYTAGVNRIGADGNKIRYSGGSMFIDPRGIPLSEPETGEKLIVQKLSHDQLHKFRKKFPVLMDREYYTIQL